jgi:mono/diheme cytochrome c family protein
MQRSILSRRFIIGWAAGILSSAAVAIGLAVWMIFGGGFDASASKQHLRPVAWASHTAMRNWVKKQAKDVRPPESFTQAHVKAGAREYEQRCIACHGGPAVPRAKWASGMIPTPPYLIDTSRHWSTAELYVIVHDGIKMTAMPAWGELEPDDNLWNVVAFLEALPGMSSDEFARMRAEVSAPSPVNPGGGSDLVSSAPFTR